MPIYYVCFGVCMCPHAFLVACPRGILSCCIPRGREDGDDEDEKDDDDDDSEGLRVYWKHVSSFYSVEVVELQI